MSRLTLRYNKNSEHFILPHGGTFQPDNGSPTEYIGTVVFRKSGSDVNAGKLDVYYIKKWQGSGIKQLSDGKEYFTNALNSPDNFEPIFDCDTIKVFAEEGYYFVDEKTGQKSLRCFNVRWWVDSKPKPVIEKYYRGCEYFSSHGRDMSVEYENGIPNVPLEQF
jgi:hypothetical protein